jgi:hypothetical protein
VNIGETQAAFLDSRSSGSPQLCTCLGCCAPRGVQALPSHAYTGDATGRRERVPVPCTVGLARREAGSD